MHDFEELALHLVLPSFAFEFLGDAEDLLDSPRDHTSRAFSLIKVSIDVYWI